MPKRASLDTEQFKVTLPMQPRDPLETLIPTTPPSPFEAKPPTPIYQSQPQNRATGPGTNQAKVEAKNERPNVRTNERKPRVKPKRVKQRHSFDIYRDQLLALQRLQLNAVRLGKRKPKLGDMVQQAIDLYLAQKSIRKKLK